MKRSEETSAVKL